MLSGEAVLLEDGKETVLKAGDAAAWEAGVPNGHCLINRSDGDAVFIEVGTRAASERAHYPDIDLKAERDGPQARYTEKMVPRTNSTWHRHCRHSDKRSPKTTSRASANAHSAPPRAQSAQVTCRSLG